MVTDHQKYDEKMFNNFAEKLDNLEKKVEENQNMLWMVTISASAVIFVLQFLPTIGLQLTPAPKTSMMGAEVVRSIG